VTKKPKEVEINECLFYLRQIPGSVHQRIITNCSEEGIPRLGDIQNQMVREAVTDWKKVCDEDGKPVEFSRDGIDLLPLDSYTQLLIAVSDNLERDDEGAEDSKNLSGTPSSPTSSEEESQLDLKPDAVSDVEVGVPKKNKSRAVKGRK